MGERLRLGLKRKGIEIGGGEEGRTVVSAGEGIDMMMPGYHHAKRRKGNCGKGLVVGLL